VFEAPLTDSTVGAIAVRQHEYGHLAVSRFSIVPDLALPVLTRFFGIAEVWVQAALDVVVNAYMDSRGNVEIRELQPVLGPLPASLRRWEVACIFLRCERLACEDRVRASAVSLANITEPEILMLRRFADKLAQAGESQLGLSIFSLRRELKMLQDLFGPVPGEDVASAVVRLQPRLITGGEIAADATGALHFDSPTNQWGELEAISPTLSDLAVPRSKGRHWRPARVGPLIFPHRALLPGSDGRAFGTRNRALLGSVLIDCSGSMHLESDHLSRILRIAPAAAIAVYASKPRDMSGGLLIVVAKNGRRVGDLDYVKQSLGAGNVIDGPALRFLASKFPKPRFWVSDGIVTGRGDTTAANLHHEVLRMLVAGQIKRVATIDDYLEGQGRGHRTY
jgi:hypothetical protein